MSNKSREKKRKRKLKKRSLRVEVAIGPPKLTGEFTVDSVPFDPERPDVVAVNVGLGLRQDYLRADIEIEDEEA